MAARCRKENFMRGMKYLLTLLVAAGLTASAAPCAADAALSDAVASKARSPKFVARDAARHPVEELTFFRLKPTMTVVELWPGGGYWTEILGPYLAAHGTYYAAVAGPADAEENAAAKKWREMVSAQGARYGTVHVTQFDKDRMELAPAGSADLIVTFRNLHNWYGDGYADAAIAACYKALKPGGLLGVEDHRGRNDVAQDPKADNGYLRQDVVVKMIEKAGFKLVGTSEINANPKDTKDYPKGVWTLPPSFAEGGKDRAKYAAIGEADNFVLLFQKPAG
jgi:predicted methyltransferase